MMPIFDNNLKLSIIEYKYERERERVKSRGKIVDQGDQRPTHFTHLKILPALKGS